MDPIAVGVQEDRFEIVDGALLLKSLDQIIASLWASPKIQFRDLLPDHFIFAVAEEVKEHLVGLDDHSCGHLNEQSGFGSMGKQGRVTRDTL